MIEAARKQPGDLASAIQQPVGQATSNSSSKQVRAGATRMEQCSVCCALAGPFILHHLRPLLANKGIERQHRFKVCCDDTTTSLTHCVAILQQQNHSQVLSGMGVDVDSNMQRIKARVLPGPRLSYRSVSKLHVLHDG